MAQIEDDAGPSPTAHVEREATSESRALSLDQIPSSEQLQSKDAEAAETIRTHIDKQTPARPSLLQLTRTCDFVAVELTPDARSTLEQTVLVQDAVYSEIEDDRGRAYCVRPPLGHRQEIAPSSAFQRVTSSRGNGATAEARDLVYIPMIVFKKNVTASSDHLLLEEGDIIVAVLHCMTSEPSESYEFD